MKNISLYVDRGTWLNRLHPYTKLLYILVAIASPFIVGKLWLFLLCMVCSLVLLASAKTIKQAVPLIAFSFTLIIVIFIIQGLFNHDNSELLLALGPVKFYKEGVIYALKIGCNILNMLLSFAVFILTTSPQELVSMVVTKSINMAKMMYINTVGIVENMAYIKCPKCDEKIRIFGSEESKKIIEESGIKVLAELPIDPKISELVDKGEIEEYETDSLDSLIEIFSNAK